MALRRDQDVDERGQWSGLEKEEEGTEVGIQVERGTPGMELGARGLPPTSVASPVSFRLPVTTYSAAAARGAAPPTAATAYDRH